jgi:hypothetical protein
MPEGRRRGIHFSKLYSFACCRPKFEENHAQIGKRGYSRVVYCNEPDRPEAVQLKYRGNDVFTTKYTVYNFVPKALFEQFRRVANIYFLVVACVSFSPLAPYTAVSVLAPLLVVIGATMAKEGVEDWRRRKQVTFEIHFQFFCYLDCQSSKCYNGFMHLLLKIICTAIYLVAFEFLVRKLDSALVKAISDVFQQMKKATGLWPYGDWGHIFIIPMETNY